MGNSIIVTSTDAVVDDNFPKVTGTTVGEKHLMDVATTSSPLATRVDEATSTVTYVGKAEIGTSAASALWQIQKIELVSTETIITWADGNNSFDNVWSDRASLSYS